MKKKVGHILLYVLAVLLLILGRTMQWALDEWANVSLDEILFTLRSPLQGTDPGVYGRYFLYALLPALVILAAVILLCRFAEKRGSAVLKKWLLGSFLIGAAAFCAIQAFRFWKTLGIGDYIHSQGIQSTYIEENYTDPKSVDITFPEKKRNLLFLYLESMETAYADREHGGIFEKNYIPLLTKLALDTEDFSAKGSSVLNGAASWKYTTWTMGALFASTSGLPLKIPIETEGIDTNFMSTQESFFPHITTLGDILKKEGYTNHLLIGSDATFGGRRLYFSEHGDYQFSDYIHYKETGGIPSGYKVFWGFEDEKLYKFAKQKLTDLAKEEQPFNLTMLTVDTHYPDGYKCRLCSDDDPQQYANAIECADRQVTEFLAWCRGQDWWENTTVIVAGDHPTMADFCDDAPKDYTRKVYTAFVNSAAEPVREDARSYSTVDFFPTTLAAMGVQIEGDRLGMGTNLFSAADTLTERDGLETIDRELSCASSWMDEQAKVEAVTADITYDPYDEQDHRISFTIRNVSSDKIDGFRCCMKMYGYQDGTKQDYIKWISAEEISPGVWRAEWTVPTEHAYDGIIKLQPTCMVDGARSNVLDLHYIRMKYDKGGANCEWYACDSYGNPL